MNQQLTTAQADANDIMESVIAKGDIAKLTPQERTNYYMQVCRSIGLNPLTRPFEYITLQGKMVLYARRDAADQLRKVNGISIEIVGKTLEEGILTVHVRAKDKTGRTDEDYGVVFVGALKGEAAANAFLKAVTKAKRRVTLSISGLGFLDETEVETIPGAQVLRETRKPPAPKPTLIVANGEPDEPMHDSITGEIVEPDLHAQGNAAASKGEESLKEWWDSIGKDARKRLKDNLPAWRKDAAKVSPITEEEDEI